MVRRIRDVLGSDRDLQGHLLELLEPLNQVDIRTTNAGYPSAGRDETTRYEALGAIGNALLDLVEASAAIDLKV